MGIKGLLPFVEKSSKRANIREFSGSTVAIDTYCWLHKGAFSCAEKLIMNEPTTMYVDYCMKYVNMLVSNNIKPILVFDGQNLPAKLKTEQKRRQNRDVSRKKGIALMRAGKVAEGRSLLRRSLDISHEMALQVIKICRRRNIDCIVAPYEADSQLGYLSLQNIAQVIITEDSDLLLFGCKNVMFKMDVNGNGILVESEKLYLSMGLRQDLFSFDKFRLMCILSGCDYIDNLPGIGLVKACKFVKKTSEQDIFRAVEKMSANLNMWTLEVTEEYRKGVVEADLTFRCQLVYDPVKRLQVPMTTPRDGEELIGELKDAKTAFNLALGNLNPRNLDRLDDYDPDKQFGSLSKVDVAMRTKHASIWSRNYSRAPCLKVVPTIMRFATVGKAIEAPSPVVKRNAQVIEDEIADEPDLISLYSQCKKLKPASSNLGFQISRYFAFSDRPVSLADSETSLLDNLGETTDNDTELSNLSQRTDLLENSQPSENMNLILSKIDKILGDTSPLECAENEHSPLPDSDHENGFDVSNESPSFLNMRSTNPISPNLKQFCSPRSSNSVLSLKNCSFSPPNSDLEETGHQSKQNKLEVNTCVGFRDSENVFKPTDVKKKVKGLAVFDTVGTPSSVFFGSPVRQDSKKVGGGRVRAGLTKPGKSKPITNQPSLARFGFFTKPPQKRDDQEI